MISGSPGDPPRRRTRIASPGEAGAIFRAWWSRPLHQNTLTDVSRTASEAINGAGLAMKGRGGIAPVFQVRAADDPARVSEVDLIANLAAGDPTGAALT